MNNNLEIAVLNNFKIQLVDFLDELIESFPKETDFIIIRIFVKDQIPTEEIMKYFCEKLCPLEDMIKTKNEKFFLDNNILFGELRGNNIEKVNYFKRLWTSGEIDEDNKKIIWSWFSIFITLANKYREITKT